MDDNKSSLSKTSGFASSLHKSLAKKLQEIIDENKLLRKEIGKARGGSEQLKDKLHDLELRTQANDAAGKQVLFSEFGSFWKSKASYFRETERKVSLLNERLLKVSRFLEKLKFQWQKEQMERKRETDLELERMKFICEKEKRDLEAKFAVSKAKLIRKFKAKVNRKDKLLGDALIKLNSSSKHNLSVLSFLKKMDKQQHSQLGFDFFCGERSSIQFVTEIAWNFVCQENVKQELRKTFNKLESNSTSLLRGLQSFEVGKLLRGWVLLFHAKLSQEHENTTSKLQTEITELKAKIFDKDSSFEHLKAELLKMSLLKPNLPEENKEELPAKVQGCHSEIVRADASVKTSKITSLGDILDSPSTNVNIKPSLPEKKPLKPPINEIERWRTSDHIFLQLKLQREKQKVERLKGCLQNVLYEVMTLKESNKEIVSRYFKFKNKNLVDHIKILFDLIESSMNTKNLVFFEFMTGESADLGLFGGFDFKAMWRKETFISRLEKANKKSSEVVTGFGKTIHEVTQVFLDSQNKVIGGFEAIDKHKKGIKISIQNLKNLKENLECKLFKTENAVILLKKKIDKLSIKIREIC